jgi:hypothetical protein
MIQILIYDLFAGGYLYTSFPPASNVVWQFPEGILGTTRDSLLKYYENYAYRPSVVIKIKSFMD